MNLSIRVEIFKEDDVYVALSPELNVSSFGDTIDEAKESIKEAIEAFLDECRDMGTLDEVLEESGFLRVENTWQSRRPVAEENYKEISLLTDNEKITLLSKLMLEISTNIKKEQKGNIYDLKGVGKEIWEGIDAQEYVNKERESWT